MLRKGSGKVTPAVDEEQVRYQLGVLDPYKYKEPDGLHLRMLRKLPDTIEESQKAQKSTAKEGKYCTHLSKG